MIAQPPLGYQGHAEQHGHFHNGVYIYRGSLINAMIAKKFNLRYKELELLIAVHN